MVAIKMETHILITIIIIIMMSDGIYKYAHYFSRKLKNG